MPNPNFPNNPGYNLYVGARYVPVFANPIEWNKGNSYEPLTVVTYQGNSFTSKTFVPANTEITNTTYWALTGNYNAQVEQYRQEVLQLSDSVSDINEKLKNYPPFVNVKDFGAVGDGKTDDTEAFQNCIDYCINNSLSMFVPRAGYLDNGGYILSKTLNIDYPMTIICDPLALMFWKNAHLNTDTTKTTGKNGATKFTSGVGINIDYGSYSGHKGYYRFGILMGDNSYIYPNATIPTGHYWTGIQVRSADLVHIVASYISFWNVGIAICDTNLGGVDNMRLSVDVLDDNNTGILFNSSNTGGIYVPEFYINTIGICQYGLSFNGNGTGIASGKFNINQIFVENTNGACIVGFAENVVNNIFNIVSCVNNHTINSTNKFGVSDDFYGPIVSGSYNALNNYFMKCSNCEFNLGWANATGYSGNTVKIYGYNNILTNTDAKVQGSVGGEISAISNTTLANFNEGVPVQTNSAYFKFSPTSRVEAGNTFNCFVFMVAALAGSQPDVTITLLGESTKYPVATFLTQQNSFLWCVGVKFYANEAIETTDSIKFILSVNR